MQGGLREGNQEQCGHVCQKDYLASKAGLSRGGSQSRGADRPRQPCRGLVQHARQGPELQDLRSSGAHQLRKTEEQLLADGARVEKNCEWVPKYGRWMVKSTPKRPYAGLSGVLDVEPQLQLRRARLRAALRPEEVAPALNHFPLLGVGDCSEPAFEPQGPLL